MMEQRKLLSEGAKLGFPGMTCTVETLIGCGSNAVVYKGYYEDQATLGERHHVLIKELNPVRKENLEAHRLSFERGNRVHLRLLEKHPEIIGGNVNTFEYHNTLYTLLDFSGGEGLDRVLQKSARETTLRRHAERMLSVLDALDAFHDSGYLHLDISPDNILLIRAGGAERLLLIDYNSVYSLEECQNGDVPYFSVKDGYTAPEVTTGRWSAIGKPADLYALTAVFFTCLTGRPLRGIVEKRKCGVDAAMGRECLKDAPDPVRSMAAAILCRGLHALPQNRYQETAQMRRDLLELIERIDGVGVTHWAIWEKSRQSLGRMLQENPSLSHIAQEDALYPIALRDDEGEKTLEACMESLFDNPGEHAMIVSAGGMGKTTALMRMTLLQNRRYSPKRAAAVYISAYGRTQDEPYFIRNSILNMLRFSGRTKNYEEARAQLNSLMDTPIVCEGRERPSLIIALDGLNEAAGNLTLLLREIEELARMKGVCMVAASRSDFEEIRAKTLALVPLGETEIAARLQAHGLLMPESREMQHLLSTPMALSIFIRAAQGESGQLRVNTTQELLRAYLDALLRKELGAAGLDSGRRYMLEAAVRYVLPALAGQTMKKKRALTPQEALAVIEGCYKLVGSKGMLRAFPAWTGRSREILGGAKLAEEWYGMIVSAILYGRMGLLAVDASGDVRISHQMIEEYLAGIDQENRRRIGRRRMVSRAKAAAAAAAVAALLYVYWLVFIYVKPYHEKLALSVMDYAGSSYVQCGLAYQEAHEIASLAAQNSLFEFNAAYEVHALGGNSMGAWIESAALQAADSMLMTGEAFAWSDKPLDEERYRELAVRAGERTKVYDGYLSVLYAAMNDQSLSPGEAQAYAELLMAFLDADAAASASLYELVTREHAHEAWTKRPAFTGMFNEINRQEALRMQIAGRPAEDLAILHEANRGSLQAAENALRRSVLSVRYSR